MSRLGAIFAGGQARRFGADKAAVEIDGVALIDRVAAALRPQCDSLIVVGREWPGLATIMDAPRPGLGPLGALAGALHYATANGYRDVLTAGCDLPDVPANLSALLTPAELATALLDHLRDCEERSMRGWIDACGARRVRYAVPIANINTPADLASYLDGRSADGLEPKR
jgi:molybdopterin-guanine dinucleotide biosynthesis protein A